jgi:glucose/arabinose dehydrogenase
MRRSLWIMLAVTVAMGLTRSTKAESLLVSGFNSNNVVEFNATTGAFSGVFIAAGSGGLSEAEQLAFAPDGSLLVDSFGSNSVLRYNGTTGAFLGQFASISSPTGLVIRDGVAYVSSYSSSGFVNSYNASTGAFLGSFVTPGSGGLGSAHGLTFGPDGNLYVSDNTHNQVLEYNGTTGAFIRVFASGDGLSLPTALTFGPDGNLYVSSDSNNRVLEFNGTTGAYISDFIGAGSGGLTDPHGLIFRGDGDLYVSGGSGVRQYNAATGAFVDLFASSSQLERPTYMVFTPQSVPEPSSLVMVVIATGLAGGVAMVSRRRRPQ